MVPGIRTPNRNFFYRSIVKAAMNQTTTLDTRASRFATWLGLGISLFGMLVIRQAFRAITPEPGPGLSLAREACMFTAAGLLLWIVRRAEGLPWTSIGIGTSPLWKSLLWGVVIAVANFIPLLAIVKWTGYGHGAASQAFAKLPVWVIFIVVVRAGIVEELFYRGYAIDRLQRIGLGKPAAIAIPLIIFSVAHWTGGAANILIAFVAAAIMTAFIYGAAILSRICSDTS
jgi:membrane protease YdiL (CAAX protease family)